MRSPLAVRQSSSLSPDDSSRGVMVGGVSGTGVMVGGVSGTGMRV